MEALEAAWGDQLSFAISVAHIVAAAAVSEEAAAASSSSSST